MQAHRPFAVCASLAAAAVSLSGCSGDGGFFPGRIKHNEGAVDYRVAPMNAAGKELDREGYLSLGDRASTPYVPLGEAEPLHTFAKTRTPEYVIDAQDEVTRKENLVKQRVEALSAKEVLQAAANERLAKAIGERDLAAQRVAAATEDLTHFAENVADESEAEYRLTSDAKATRQEKMTADLSSAQLLAAEPEKPIDTRKKDVADARVAVSTADSERRLAKEEAAKAQPADADGEHSAALMPRPH